MFVVTEAEAAAIRAVYEQRGELSAAVELRRPFPASPTTRRRGRAPGPSPAGAAAAGEADARAAAATSGPLTRAGCRGDTVRAARLRAVHRGGEEVASPGHCRFTMPGTGSHGSALSARAPRRRSSAP